MLSFDIATGILLNPTTGQVFASRPYQYTLNGCELTTHGLSTEGGAVVLTGTFETLHLTLRQELRECGGGIEESITLTNSGHSAVVIEEIALGFRASLSDHPDWSLCAIPFRVQLDGSRHDYSTQALSAGKFHNAVFEDSSRHYMPPLTESGILRSEAWAWGPGDSGLVIIKYNNKAIELSVVEPKNNLLRFGGAGLCLYGEPSGARRLEAGQAFTFGATTYLPYSGGLEQAFAAYRAFQVQHGHGFPATYDPPINWNELYDVGWHHSRTADLQQFYTREALLREAAKAREMGCDLLYLDPGWEVCEGTTVWDESRLGEVRDLVRVLLAEYGLALGYRTILRTYQDYWPVASLITHTDGSSAPVAFPPQTFQEPCLCAPAFQQEKLSRTLAISEQGVRFMMVDEYDWRGACCNPNHGHPVPTHPIDHVLAVYQLCAAVRAACPGLTIETHDPVWPWSQSIYVPTYFQQGFGEQGAYDENWGFEYMWDCLNDLRSGRALALYYYNLACNIPLYLHITMAADNDACVFFWWAASTVRHLGLGGKYSSKTIEPAQGLPVWDPETRFEAYKGQMRIYRRLKPYFVRGTFTGLSETAHLHSLPGLPGGVVNLFNLTDATQTREIFISLEDLQTRHPLPIEGAEAHWRDGGVSLCLVLPAMTPALVCIGAAIAA